MYHMYRLKDSDIDYLIRACKYYQNSIGSEYMWEKYEKIIEKLKLYLDQNTDATRMEYP